jgi:D-galactarolactone cycloisomerase
MKITRITAYAIKIPRDFAASRGTAGTPASLRESENEYRRAATYQTLYSTKIETALVKIETDAGVVGWGEAQSPLAPEVVCTIIRTLLAPQLIGADPMAHEQLWQRMYGAMRVRGHTGSFMLDAIAGIDMALWDIKGRALNAPICELLGGSLTESLPTYISGLAGKAQSERVAQAQQFQAQGFNAFKIFMDAAPSATLALFDGLREALGSETRLMVDALWRLNASEAVAFGEQLDARGATWLEAPLMPEDVTGHTRLAAQIKTAVAIGESYRTRWEMKPFFDAGAVEIFQPDIGRTGITEGIKLIAMADTHQTPVALHVSIGLGVQIAAALHVAASIPNLMFVEYNPQVYQVAERLLKAALPIGAGTLGVPTSNGLGIEIDEAALEQFIVV